ncbi:lysophospholipid acyltransferase 1-like isoform X2 [Leptopilina heterotoma]|uniref:lysophospholipid acyltransferase 1-like isoform X2 n=1 Tax=Leptopilina heterotoma TaxID=63436 RepID=UPI001CA87B33|nr:lysophospholipid acyltransferase 1-like isoform X2 [Leptopilina heterotoma]
MLLEIKNQNDFEGSKLFIGLSNYTGINLDKINFMISYSLAFVLAGFLRSSLSIEKTSTAVRHIFNIVVGVIVGYFCFGRHALHLAGFSTLIQVFIASMVYLSCIHLYIQFGVKYGSNTLDISGPLMIMTAKVSTLACSLHDGLSRRHEDLTPMQKKRLVKEKPRLLDYYSFMLSFLTLLAGPVTFYDEYQDFISNRQMQEAQKKISAKKLNSTITFVALKKAIYGYLPVIAVYPILNVYKIENLLDTKFMETSSYTYQLWYMNMLVSVKRFQYYYAWIIAEAICNNAGFGLNGLDENNKPRMDLLTNINIWKLETAINMYEYSKYWNSATIRWLRFVIYDRMPNYKREWTYLTSTVWHGFQIGYYISAFHAALYVYAERSVHKHVRPFIVSSGVFKFFYDILTTFTTRFAIAFTGTFYVLSEANTVGIYFLRELYLMQLILTISCIILPPILLPIRKEPRLNNVKESENENDKNKVE